MLVIPGIGEYLENKNVSFTKLGEEECEGL